MLGHKVINTPPHFAYPAISVVIPMYNAEEYIGECLDSFLMQTFPYFEVIVVDDCSTDNSVAVVESYIPKFGGRLRLTRTAENSGSAGRPRNVGFGFVRGEYVFFADADDFLLLTGLETLYKAAKTFNADVTYMASYYRMDIADDVRVVKDADGDDLAAENLEDKPTLTVNDTDKIVYDYLNRRYHHTPWSLFTRRDFLIANGIFFPEGVRSGEDGIWNIHIRCFAKRFLRIPEPIYFRRCYNPESITRKKHSTEKQISQRINSFSAWLQSLREASTKLEFLAENPDYAYDAFKVELDWILGDLREYRTRLKTREIYKVLYNELAEENDSPNWMVPLFFAFIDEQKKKFDRLERASNNFKHFITGRIDVRFFSKTDDAEFDLISVSDEKASVTQPDWIKQNGTGYMIQSFVGDLELVGKANSDGKIRLALRGMDVRDPKDSTKRIPCWIDFTKLSVNDGVVFNKIISVWHNKSYDYDFNVRAGQEIKINVEWLPRLKGIGKLKEMQELQAREFNRLKEMYRALTGRMDIKFAGAGDIKLLSVSDERAKITQPDWIQKDGSGYVIESIVGAIKVVLKATEDGLINLNLRGIDVRDPQDKSKRIPSWIDYTKFSVNDSVVFDKIISVWHNRSYDYDFNVKAGQEVTVKVAWLPHLAGIEKLKEMQEFQAREINRLKEMYRALTGRMDIKFAGAGDIKLLSISDERAKITQPDWILKDGNGYVIESIVGTIKVAFKATEDGLINLILRGVDVRNPKDRSKRLPYWVDFTSFTVNGRQVLNKITSVWHNEPYTCDLNVKAGMEVVIELKWHPHIESINKMQEIQVAQQQEINRLKKMLAAQTQEINRLKGM